MRVEGFEAHKLITRCISKKLELTDVRIISDVEFTVTVKKEDYKRFRKYAGSAYRITELGESGSGPILEKLLRHRAALAGFFIFAALIYFQSLFVHEIRIYGYEAFSEEYIRQVLREQGFYEGAFKLRTREQIDELELAIFDALDDISYVQVEYEGSLGKVTIAESRGQEKAEEEGSFACNIVADKAGYVYELLPRTGVRAAEDGAFVNPGDVLISGIVPLSSTAYGTPFVNMTEQYVHAEGTVKLKVPHRMIVYTEADRLIRQKTGKMLPGIIMTLGDRVFNTQHLFRGYEAAEYYERDVIDHDGKFRFKFSLNLLEEVSLSAEKKQEDGLKSEADAYIRRFMKENLPESVQIYGKDLNFTQKGNIIVISILLETIEETGTVAKLVPEQEIKFDEDQN